MIITSLEFDWSEKTASAAKALFGNPGRVVVAAWILSRNEPFYLQECQQGVAGYGVAASGVRTELNQFVDHGLLTRYEDGRRVYFSQIKSPFWPAFEAIVASLRATEAR
jgi:hypothetical protein